MVYLPNEIINLILSFREINPISLLVKGSVEDCNRKSGFIVSPYYAFALVYNHHYLRNTEYNLLINYYELKNRKLTIKKKMKGIKFTYNESIQNDLKRDVEKIDKKYDGKRRAIFYPIIGIRPKN